MDPPSQIKTCRREAANVFSKRIYFAGCGVGIPKFRNGLLSALDPSQYPWLQFYRVAAGRIE